MEGLAKGAVAREVAILEKVGVVLKPNISFGAVTCVSAVTTTKNMVHSLKLFCIFYYFNIGSVNRWCSTKFD